MLKSDWFASLHRLAVGLATPKGNKPARTEVENETVYQTLVEAIGRHPTAEDDPDVMDALLSVREALMDNTG